MKLYYPGRLDNCAHCSFKQCSFIASLGEGKGWGRCKEEEEGEVLSVQMGGLNRAKQILYESVDKGKSGMRVWRRAPQRWVRWIRDPSQFEILAANFG